MHCVVASYEMLVLAGLWNVTLSAVNPIMSFVRDNWSCAADLVSYVIRYHRVFFHLHLL